MIAFIRFYWPSVACVCAAVLASLVLAVLPWRYLA